MGNSEVSKEQLYGVYQAQNDIENKRNNSRADWKDQTHRAVVNKSLDLAMTEGDDMGDVTANKTYTGMTWQHLAVIALGGLVALGIVKYAPQQQPIQPTVVQQPVPLNVIQPQQPSPTNQGYRILIKDKTTGQPIRVDWINQTPKQNESTSPIVPSN